MNIGGRIVKRLKELNWDRRDLLDRVPDLTPQALSNLINRDSVRSEWDERIADALGVSVLWLVYNCDNNETPPTQPPVKEHQKLISGFDTADQTARETMLWLAERALAKRFRRTGGMSTGAPEVSTVIDQYLNNIEGLPEGQTLPLLQRTLEKNHQQQKTAKKDRDERPVPRRNNSSSKIS